MVNSLSPSGEGRIKTAKLLISGQDTPTQNSVGWSNVIRRDKCDPSAQAFLPESV